MASSSAASKCVKWILAGWTGFVCENLVLSENRTYIIDHIGDARYHTMYNTLSTIACGSVAFGYMRYGPGRILNNTGIVRSAVALTTASLGAIGLSQLLPTFQIPIGGNGSMRCPFDFHSGKNTPDDGGLVRVTRHPMLYSLGMFGLGVGLMSPYAGRLALFSGPLLVALVGTHHQDYRYRRGIGGSLTVERDARTSNIPFYALLTGRQQWGKLVEEIKLPNCGVAMSIVALLFLSRTRSSALLKTVVK